MLYSLMQQPLNCHADEWITERAFSQKILELCVVRLYICITVEQ